MRFLFLLSLFILSACDDATIVNGKVRLSGEGVTAVVSNAIGEKKYGYAEIKFYLEADVDTEREIGVLVRANTQQTSHSCIIQKNAIENTTLAIWIGENPIETLTIPDMAVGDHTLGCEVTNVANHDVIRLFYDGDVKATFTEDATHAFLAPSGKFGFNGSSASNEIGIMSFVFADVKPKSSVSNVDE